MRLLLLVLLSCLLGGDATAIGSLSTRLRTFTPMGPVTALTLVERETYPVLIIISDDLGDGGIAAGCGADCAINMPSIAALRAAGIRFTNFNVQTVCAPTRATKETGRETFQHGTTDAGGIGYKAQVEYEFSQALRTSYDHYVSGHFGKLGLNNGGFPNITYAHMGYDRFQGSLGPLPGIWYGPFNYEDSIYPTEGGTSSAPADEFKSDTITGNGIAWINSLPTGQKFVAVYSNNLAHTPNIDPPLTYGGGSPDATPEDCDAATEEDCVLAMIRYLDSAIGAVVTATIAKDPNTLVIYMPDNGDSWFFDPPGSGKGSEFLNGFRGEAIFAYGNIPAGKRGTTFTKPTNAIDIFPTLMDYAGINNLPHTGRVGFSLRTVLTGECTDTGRLAGLCWDGIAPRCTYAHAILTPTRIMTCNTATSDGYKYVLNLDGTNPRIYEYAVSETVECVDAPCLAAKAELEVLLPAYDGLPAAP